MATRLIVLTFESVREVLWCGPSNDTSSAVLTFTWYYSICNRFYLLLLTKSYKIKMKPTSYIPMVLSIFNT